MTRTIVMGIIMAFAVGLVGCRACLAPYDYCQPTFLPERGDQCMGELYRCGSNLGGMERTTDENGYCEDCGGGYVEYYASNEGQSFDNEALVQEQELAQSSEPAIPTNQRELRSVSYNANDFALNDDASENY
jgi:hypothetical protein